MSLSLSAISANTAHHEPELSLKPAADPAVKLSLKPAVDPSVKLALKPAVDPTDKPVAKLPAAQQIEQLAIQGQTAQQIATTVGLPEAEVNLDLGTTASSSTTAASQASALLALGARLSVHA